MGGERRWQKSLRIGVHHANVVVWGPVYRTRLMLRGGDAKRLVRREVDREARPHAHERRREAAVQPSRPFLLRDDVQRVE
eukprot:31058-Pelagococcus_subviridis.AAC.17